MKSLSRGGQGAAAAAELLLGRLTQPAPPPPVVRHAANGLCALAARDPACAAALQGPLARCMHTHADAAGNLRHCLQSCGHRGYAAARPALPCARPHVCLRAARAEW
jgi:hypothetical protein